jgi:hypothetical protein
MPKFLKYDRSDSWRRQDFMVGFGGRILSVISVAVLFQNDSDQRRSYCVFSQLRTNFSDQEGYKAEGGGDSGS